MRVCSLISAWTMPLLLATTASGASRDQDGQYFCVVEHVAGVTYPVAEKNQPAYSGKISIPDNDMKFFVQVSPVTYDDIAHTVCTNDVNYWFKSIFEKGIPYRDGPPPGNANADAREWIGKNCFTSDELTWKSLDGKQKWTFRGYNGFQYYGPAPETWFELYKDAGHTFMMGFGYDAGPVVEYGHCTKITAPKN